MRTLMKKNMIMMAAAVLLAIPSFSMAAASSGLLGGAFTDSGIATRAMALGGAFTAVADDGNASFWNPAGMALLGKDKSMCITYVPDYYGAGSAYKVSDILASYAQGDTQGFGAIGGTVRYLSADLGADYTGDLEHKWTEYIAMVSWGMQIEKYIGLPKYAFPKIAIGANLKYLGQSSDLTVSGSEISASGFGLDLSAMVAFKDNFRLGLMAKNIFTQVTWNSGTKESVPYSVNCGLFYGITSDLSIMGEVKSDQDSSGVPELTAYCGGIEYKFEFGKTAQVQAAFIRGGMQFDPDNNSYILSGGASIVMENFTLDYAYQQFLQTDIGTNNNRLGITANF
jgi:hypothetical protein